MTRQNRSMPVAPTAARRTAVATSAELSPSFETFLATIRCWLDHARGQEVIAPAGLVNAECDRRGQSCSAPPMTWGAN